VNHKWPPKPVNQKWKIRGAVKIEYKIDQSAKYKQKR